MKQDELEEVVKPLRIVLPTEIVESMKRRVARFTDKKIAEARKQGAELQMKVIEDTLNRQPKEPMFYDDGKGNMI